jgi:hypothetical protein
VAEEFSQPEGAAAFGDLAVTWPRDFFASGAAISLVNPLCG